SNSSSLSEINRNCGGETGASCALEQGACSAGEESEREEPAEQANHASRARDEELVNRRSVEAGLVLEAAQGTARTASTQQGDCEGSRVLAGTE
ncbi:unnamed protein product, partial [Amoebophrya sp. A120]